MTARLRLILLLPVMIGFCLTASGQMGFAFDIKKPEEYDERVLRSEKSDQGKFGLPKRFMQNTATHFNYYFNANNKLNEVLERAKESFKDDYSKLLPFYNYTLDATAADSIQLDSITYKSSTGVALHDLRGDWVDNLYLLWGASFYLQKKFDSAYLMFQFINYAFAPKEKDGYYLTIGSGRDGNSALSIATKEKKSLPKKIMGSVPPSRNDAFIWQIRTFLVQDQFAEAASLIVTLKNDPAFPKRLMNDLHEVQAYWFYKNNMWDSAAFHLTEALSNAGTLQEKARWEYLAAQLYEMSGHHKEAEKYYGKVISHTTDLVLEIYARLATIRTDKDGGEKSIEKNAEELVKMAKRDKYEEYKDIIYYMAAQMLLEANNVDGAMALLKKSTQFPGNDPSQRNKAFLQLAELSLSKKLYRQAYNYYDSINLSDPAIKNAEAITLLKKSLGVIAVNYEIIVRQDSLQRIAMLPEDERKSFVKQVVKQLRKQQGLKDEGQPGTGGSSLPPVAIDNLFPANQPKGDWYFYNAVSKARGLTEFKSKWGNRPNVDSWRRSAAIVGVVGNNPSGTQGSTGTQQGTAAANTELTYDALYANLPLTEEQLKKSNDSIQEAMFTLGKAYIQSIEDCKLGTETLEQLRSRYPAFPMMEQVLFNLYYCYNKNGETANAAAIKKLMSEKYPNSPMTTIVVTGKNPALTEKDVATKTYEGIYDLFIEGKFDQALAEKKIADEKYGKHYWSPQLLYIEAVYHIKQRNDSIAMRVLDNIVSQFSSSPLAPKAKNMMDVLKRRAQIEEELRNLVVTRATDTTAGRTSNPSNYVDKPKTDTVTSKPPVTPPVVVNPPVTKDTSAVKPVQPKNNTAFTNDPNQPHYVVVLLNKVDPVFVNEAKNAFARYNRDTYYNKTYSVDLFQLDTDNRLLLIAPFANAQDAIKYMDAAKPKTPSEILPWLKGGKYSFLIMTDGNFDHLKANPDTEAYKNFLNLYWPGKF